MRSCESKQNSGLDTPSTGRDLDWLWRQWPKLQSCWGQCHWIDGDSYRDRHGYRNSHFYGHGYGYVYFRFNNLGIERQFHRQQYPGRLGSGHRGRLAERTHGRYLWIAGETLVLGEPDKRSDHGSGF
jgi:hypothetical protein